MSLSVYVKMCRKNVSVATCSSCDTLWIRVCFSFFRSFFLSIFFSGRVEGACGCVWVLILLLLFLFCVVVVLFCFHRFICIFNFATDIRSSFIWKYKPFPYLQIHNHSAPPQTAATIKKIAIPVSSLIAINSIILYRYLLEATVVCNLFVCLLLGNQ